ncbi:MAG: nucleoside kinase [Rikenellaceae bacterium]
MGKQREQIEVIICERERSRTVDIEAGSSLLEIATEQNITSPHKVIAAYVNNRIKQLDHKIYSPANLRFVDIMSFAGMRVYQRTISLVMQCAVEQTLPHHKLYIRHSMGPNGLYCEVESRDEESTIIAITPEEVCGIGRRMMQIVEEDAPITRHKLPTERVKKIYLERGYTDKVELLETRPRLYSEIYTLHESVGYFYGPLAPSSGYVSRFEVEPYHRGFYIGMPRRDAPNQLSVSPHQSKMFDVFQLHQRWVDVMKVQTVGALNTKILAGDSSEMIKLSEALAERAVAMAADAFAAENVKRGCRVILLAGPSSSGKTTTSKRLGVQLQLLGFCPVLISLDDYFVDRELTPLDENGEFDFEALEAIDLKRFNENLNDLFKGESVDIPRYDFISGKSRLHAKPLKLEDNSILIIEGIHGLNPHLVDSFDEKMVYRIYTSCFTTVAMDDASRIASADNRLLRRLTRDNAQRGTNATSTLKRWASVRRGEERHIFPYQENADWMINTAQFYEIAVVKPFAEKILREVPNTGVEYEEALRLLKMLDHFLVIEPTEIPPTSTLREFIGGGSFTY